MQRIGDFEIHHQVNELSALLKCNQDVTASAYVDMLNRNITPYVTTQVSSHNAKIKICESTTTPERFQEKYLDLKSRNFRNLEPLIFLLSKLSDDTKNSLEKHCATKPRVYVDDAKHTPSRPHSSSAGGGAAKQRSSTITAAGESSQHHSGSLPSSKANIGRMAFLEITDNLKKEEDKSNKKCINKQPDWISTRNNQSNDYPSMPSIRIKENLQFLPASEQEDLLLTDLLNLLQGIDGVYIQSKANTNGVYDPRSFNVDPSLDNLLCEHIDNLLKVCSDFSLIVRFINEKSSGFPYGRVNQALSAALDIIIKEYFVLIEQMQYRHQLGTLTLFKLWFFIKSFAEKFRIITTITNAINKGNSIGGSVLTILHNKMSNILDNSEIQKIILYLTKAACVPFFKILETWIYKGIIIDQYSEFLISENKTYVKSKLIDDFNGAYWKLHYTISRNNVPVFLEKYIKKMLDTGKYLNVVRESGKDVEYTAPALIYSSKAVHGGYGEHIQGAYLYASNVLLEFLITDHDLKGKLQSIRNYFLLERGDFVTLFMDMADSELRKNVKNIALSRLEALVGITLSKSTASNDPYREDLRIKFLPYDLVTQLFKILKIQKTSDEEISASTPDLNLSGLEALSLDFNVQWPISLIINRNTLTKYEMLFRHLFYTKHVERLLNSIWQNNKGSKLANNKAVFSLRQRMLHFVVTFLNFMNYEIISPNWDIFIKKIDEAVHVDDILNYQNKFLDTCLADCMLTSTQLLKNVHKMMMVCITFANFLQRVDRSTIADRDGESFIEKEMDDSFNKSIYNFEKNFNALLLKFVHTIQTVITNDRSMKIEDIRFTLIYNLNYNNFYTEQLDNLSVS